jgi:hypothetical protein
MAQLHNGVSETEQVPSIAPPFQMAELSGLYNVAAKVMICRSNHLSSNGLWVECS